MPFDGLTLGLVAREMDKVLTGGRVNKIIQPERDEIILTIRNGGENRQLLLSATANCARALPCCAAASTSRMSLLTPDRPRKPDWLDSAFITASRPPSFSHSMGRQNTSKSPTRLLWNRPDWGVAPMEAAMLFPSSMTHRLLEPPRWQLMIRRQ